MASAEQRFWSKVNLDGPTAPHLVTQCWVWTACVDGFGYGKFGSLERAHRFSWKFHVGSIPDGMCVLHHCDNPACVRPLYLGTKKNNAQDREQRGRGNHAVGSRNGCATHPGLRRGSRNGRAKLTETRVRKLLEQHFKHGRTKTNLARDHGLSKTTVGHIVSGKLWPHVEGRI